LISIFTPTYNRLQKLKLAYESLLKQTCYDFEWIIVDDGSNDQTSKWVQEIISSSPFNITYEYKENGGKHSTFQYAGKLSNCEYVLQLDSDDTLTSNAVFLVTEKIKELNTNPFFQNVVELRFLCIDSKTNQVHGNIKTLDETLINQPITWHEIVLKNGINNEFVNCIKTAVLVEVTKGLETVWMKDKIKFISEMVFWARVGRKYQTLIVNEAIRIYNSDSADGYINSTKQKNWYFNELVSNQLFLDENFNYLHYNFKYFINIVIKNMVMIFMLKISIFKILHITTNAKLKFGYLTLLPLGFILNLYFKHFKKKYW